MGTGGGARRGHSRGSLRVRRVEPRDELCPVSGRRRAPRGLAPRTRGEGGQRGQLDPPDGPERSRTPRRALAAGCRAESNHPDLSRSRGFPLPATDRCPAPDRDRPLPGLRLRSHGEGVGARHRGPRGAGRAKRAVGESASGERWKAAARDDLGRRSAMGLLHLWHHVGAEGRAPRRQGFPGCLLWSRCGDGSLALGSHRPGLPGDPPRRCELAGRRAVDRGGSSHRRELRSLDDDPLPRQERGDPRRCGDRLPSHVPGGPTRAGQDADLSERPGLPGGRGPEAPAAPL